MKCPICKHVLVREAREASEAFSAGAADADADGAAGGTTEPGALVIKSRVVTVSPSGAVIARCPRCHADAALPPPVVDRLRTFLVVHVRQLGATPDTAGTTPGEGTLGLGTRLPA